MVENLMSANQVSEYLGITINNLRQIQFRKQLIWAERKGRSVFYRREDVEAFGAKRKKIITPE